jgi:uncharacterized membrane protein HdeD (DUF308 family)
MATTDGPPVRNQERGFDAVAPEPRHTALRLTMGILSIIVGILVIAHPINTLLFVAILLGIQLVILGIIRLALAASAPTRGLKVGSIVLGVVTILAGLVCFFRPNASLFVLAILLAAGWIADGIADVIRAFSKRSSGIEKTYVLLLGVVSVVAGLVVAFFPGESLVLLTQTAGIALLVLGLLSCLSALLRRRRTA